MKSLDCRKRGTDQTVAPDEQSTDWSEGDANDEERWKDGFGGEDGLPCLQTLLLEGSIYSTVSNSGRGCGSWVGRHVLAGLLQLLLSFLVSEVSVDSVAGLFPRRKMAMA